MAVKLIQIAKAGPKQLPAWRTICRRRAQKQATAEARKAWKVKANKAILFNYRWEHVQAVVSLALWLAQHTGADPETVEAAAWLHDISKGQPSHGQMGAKEAKTILDGTDFPPDKIAGVVDAIARHVGLYRAAGAPVLQPVEAAVLWDADKLSKLGIEALAYNLSATYLRGLELAQRRNSMLEFTRSVLRRTVDSMNTGPGRALAEERYRAMLSVLEAWEQEKMAIEGETT